MDCEISIPFNCKLIGQLQINLIANKKQTGFNKIVFDVCVMHVLQIHNFWFNLLVT